MPARYQRHVSRALFLFVLLAAGSASASMVDLSGSCIEEHDNSLRDTKLATPVHGHFFGANRIGIDPVPRIEPESRWTLADARRHVERDYHFHQHQIHGRDDSRHGTKDDYDHDHHGGDDQGPPKPTPLPGAAVLFAPALLGLRLIQRRAA
jgi:hypothetical protein